VINNREMAGLLWIAVVLAAGLTRSSIRTSLFHLCRLLIGPKLAIPILALAGWSSGVALAGRAAGLWNTGLTGSTAVWFALTALVLLLNVNRAGEHGFFRQAAVESIKASVVVETFVNFYVFSLPAELALFPVVAMLAAASAVASHQQELARAKGCANVALTGIGLSLLVYASVRAIEDWHNFVTTDTARAFALPLWMTLGVIPFVYVVGLYSSYELAFVSIDLATEDPASRRRAKLALCATLHIRLGRVSSFVGMWPRLVARAASFRDARKIIDEFLTTPKGGQPEKDVGNL